MKALTPVPRSYDSTRVGRMNIVLCMVVSPTLVSARHTVRVRFFRTVLRARLSPTLLAGAGLTFVAVG